MDMEEKNKILITNRGLKEIEKYIQKKIVPWNNIFKAMKSLCRNPREGQVEKLKGWGNRWALRINEQYRMIYEIIPIDDEDRALIIDISNHNDPMYK